MTCPQCSGTVTIDPHAETPTTTWRRNKGAMPYVETTWRLCIVAFCDRCDYAVELNKDSV